MKRLNGQSVLRCAIQNVNIKPKQSTLSYCDFAFIALRLFVLSSVRLFSCSPSYPFARHSICLSLDPILNIQTVWRRVLFLSKHTFVLTSVWWTQSQSPPHKLKYSPRHFLCLTAMLAATVEVWKSSWAAEQLNGNRTEVGHNVTFQSFWCSWVVRDSKFLLVPSSCVDFLSTHHCLHGCVLLTHLGFYQVFPGKMSAAWLDL